jgi:hypothetical protein
MHVLHALLHDITGSCMQLLHGLCCFDFISDIPFFLSVKLNQTDYDNQSRSSDAFKKLKLEIKLIEFFTRE